MRFDHVSIAVASIDRGVDFFTRYFPTHPRNDKQVSEQAQGGFLWQDFYLGGTPVEFIEELPGHDGFIAQFIRRHGEGLHHICYEIDRLDPMIAALKAGGVRIVDEHDFPGRTEDLLYLAALGLRRVDSIVAAARLRPAGAAAGRRWSRALRSRCDRGARISIPRWNSSAVIFRSRW